jgi:arylsulfatase A-like enzyme
VRSSRATFLTGQHAHNHKVLNNVGPTGGYRRLDHTNTLATWLQAAGYYTAHIGKYLNGYGVQVPRTTIPPGWTEWYGTPDPDAYAFYNYSINENGTLVFYGEGEENYQTDVYARKATDFIQRMAAQTTPFFLSIAPLPPHEDPNEAKFTTVTPGPEPAPRHKGLFQNESLPRPPSFNEADVSDKPAMIRALPRLSSTKINSLTTAYRRRLESLLAVDELLKAVMDTLAATNQLDKTVVIFTSDNGYLQGEHRLASPNAKVFLYEESIRVPSSSDILD